MYLRNRTEKDFKEEIKTLKDFLQKDLVKETLLTESDNRYLRSAKLQEDDELFTQLGCLDRKTNDFTLYSKDEITKILAKEFEPKVFYVRKRNESGAYHFNLPYYTYVILFRVGDSYYRHNPEYDCYDFMKTVRNFYKNPNNLIHVTNFYESKPNKDGSTYVIQIYKTEDYIRYYNTIQFTVRMSLREYRNDKSYDISNMELDDLIETFEITNKEAIDFIKECFDNDGLICETNRLFSYNEWKEFMYIPKKVEIKALYDKLDNLKKSITFVEQKPLQSNVRYIEEE